MKDILDAIELIGKLRNEIFGEPWIIRRILMHAEQYIENQFKSYLEA